MDLLNCPHCSQSLIHSEIPEDKRCNDNCDRANSDYDSECWKNHIYGKGKYFLKTVGMEIPRVYDGILYWICPACDGTWHRWEEGTVMREKAQKYLDSL